MSAEGWVFRSSERLRVTLHARYRTPAESEADVTIVNVSADGCCLVPNGPPPPIGQHLLIRLESGDSLVGDVRWVKNGRVGVKFDQVFSRKRVEYLRREHSTFLSETEWPEEQVQRSVL